MKKLLSAVALAACAVFGANAATFRVAGTGGTHESIQDAIDAASDGDTILVGQGTYEAINTQGKKITIRSECGAEETKIVGGKNALGGLRNATAALLMSDADNNSIYDSSEDPAASGKYDVVNEWVTWTPEDIGGSTLEGFTIQVDSLGFAPTYDGEIFGVVGGRVKNCRFICPTDRNIGGYAHMNLSVAENCLFVSGELDEEVISDSILRNCTVYTKTFICASAMANTIVYGCSERVDLDEAERPTLANCVFYGVSGVSGRSGVTIADPLFVDAANGDFRLKGGSPCIDKGGTAYGDFDLALDPRVCNGKVDIGCYEYQTFDAVEWPSWVIGTWAGRNEGFYEMTLSSSGVSERWEVCEEEMSGNRTNAWKDMKITDQADCHFVMTCWYWNTEHDTKCNAEMTLRQEGCSHYDKSSCSETSDTFDSGIRSEWVELTKLEMSTAPAEGWPEWVIGMWSGEILNYVPDKRETYKGTYTLTVSATGTKEKYVFDGGDVINHNDDLKGWVITDKADCHIVGTCWCWNDEKDDWFDAKFVFRNTACSHYAQSSCLSIMHAGDSAGKDTCEVSNLKKDGGDPAPSVPTVSATAADVSAVYDGAAHGISVSVKSPASGVTVEYALSQDGPWKADAITFTDACAATKVWYRALADGHLGVTNAATVTVSPRPISNATLTLLGIPEEGYKYDGAAKTPAVSVTDTLEGFSSSEYDAPVYSDNVNAGTAKVVVTGVGNYAGTVETTFTIAPRSLTFTSASAEWAWDGEAHSCETTPTVSGDGFVGTDGATFSGFKSVTAPGSYENTFTYAFTDGTVAANYNVTQTYGRLRIFNYKATVKDDGTMRIDGLGDEPLGSSELAITEKIDGVPVTEVAEGAFANSTCGATSLTLAKFCKKIGASAFRGIGTLRTVTFVKVYETDGVTEAKLEIGANAFNSTAVAALAVPDYVQQIGDYAFANCGSLKRVSVAAGTTVSAKAFYRSGITAGKKPEVLSLGAFSVAGSVATMEVTGTGGTIDVSGLKVCYATSLAADATWAELEYRTGETVLTETGCKVTVTVDVPADATSGVFFRAELAE